MRSRGAIFKKNPLRGPVWSRQLNARALSGVRKSLSQRARREASGFAARTATLILSTVSAPREATRPYSENNKY